MKDNEIKLWNGNTQTLTAAVCKIIARIVGIVSIFAGYFSFQKEHKITAATLNKAPNE
jgi:hypothetical protein